MMRVEGGGLQVKVSEHASKSSMKALDPLLETLSFFENPADLDYRIARMFIALDVEHKQLIGYKVRHAQALSGMPARQRQHCWRMDTLGHWR